MSDPLRTAMPIVRPVDCNAIKRNAFRDQDTLIVSINDLSLSPQEREILRQIGERLYGNPKRPGS